MTNIMNRARLLPAVLRFIYLQRVTGFDNPGAPHLDPETLARFKLELTRCRSYLEFGSGGSTVLVDREGIPAVSVESDPFYAAAVQKVLSPGTKVRVITPSMGMTKQWGWPVFGATRKGRRYVLAPYPLEPDLILVDGRYRVACALAAAHFAYKSTKTATLIMDDYEDRPHYSKVENYLGRPERVGRSAIFQIGTQKISLSSVIEASTDAF